MATTYKVQLVGDIWQPGFGPCAIERNFMADDDEDAMERLFENTGDFSNLLGFRLITPGCRHEQREIEDWSTLSNDYTPEEIEMIFLDCMFPIEEMA